MAFGAEILNRGKTVTLRRTVPNDAAWLFHQAYSNREFMRLFRLNDNRQTEADVHRFLVQQQQTPPDQETYLEMAIVHNRLGFIGIAAAADYRKLHQRTELLMGIFDPAHRSLGIGTEVGLLLLDLMFNRFKLNKVTLDVYEYNQSVQKILETLFEKPPEGIRKDHIYDPETEQFIDLYEYGLTDAEFRVNRLISRMSRRLIGRDIAQPTDWETMRQRPFIPSGSILIGN